MMLIVPESRQPSIARSSRSIRGHESEEAEDEFYRSSSSIACPCTLPHFGFVFAFMLLVAFALAEWLRTFSSKEALEESNAARRPHSADAKFSSNFTLDTAFASSHRRRSDICILHVAFGQAYINLGKKSIPNKRRYADRWGYEMIVMEHMTLAGLVDAEFGSCNAHGVRPGLGYDVQTLLKLCGVLSSFRRGCREVVWTDADSVIARPDVPISHWTEKNVTADVIWSTDNLQGRETWCRKGVLNSTNRLASCVNTAIFVMRNTAWTTSYIWRILDLSRRSHEQACTTRYANPEGYDQCFFTKWYLKQTRPGHEGDQCVIACDLLANTSHMDHFHIVDNDEHPTMQYCLIAVNHFPRWLFKFREVYLPEDAFLINCVAHWKEVQTDQCVRFITDKLSNLERY